MRRARAGDSWRHLDSRPYKIRPLRLSFDNIQGVGSGVLPLQAGLVALCGTNGVGKSTLLHALHAAASDEASSSLESRVRFRGATLALEYETSEGNKTITTSYSSDGVPTRTGTTVPSVSFIDASATARSLRRLMSTNNFDEVLDGLSPIEEPRKRVDAISFLVGKDYESRLTYEIDEFDELGVFPYFEVKAEGARYRSPEMGFGELALHVLDWSLPRKPKDGIIFVEEPDAHVSPKSQTPLVETLVAASVRSGSSIFIATHSESLIEALPPERIRLLARAARQVRVISSPTLADLRCSLGIRRSPTRMVLVEDPVAKTVLTAVLRELCPHVLPSIEIRCAGSDSVVLRQVDEFPVGSADFAIVGVFDGDSRPKIESEMAQRTSDLARDPTKKPLPRWGFTFLPGASGPDAMLREHCRDKTDLLADKLGLNRDRVFMAAGNVSGLDVHDWFPQFARALEVSEDMLAASLVRLWLDVDGNRNLAGTFSQELIMLLERDPP